MSTTFTSLGLACTNPEHDHEHYDEEAGGQVAGVAMTCPDCHQPTHYDEGCADYVHDDPAAPPCFLKQRGWPADATPCYVDLRDVENLSGLRNLVHELLAVREVHHQSRVRVAFVDDHGRPAGGFDEGMGVRLLADGTTEFVVVR